jgi:hypothetical protein
MHSNLPRKCSRWCGTPLFGTALGLALLAPPIAARAQTATTVFGSLFNFDVYNDTGEVAHGFEIELDGSAPPVAFFPDRYGEPSVTPFAGGYYVRYVSAWDPAAQQFKTGTPPLTGPITRTTAEPCIPANVPLSSNPAPCDHNGVRFDAVNVNQVSTAQPTNVIYRWLIADPQHPGQLIPSGTLVSIPAPIWTVIPPAQVGAAPVVVAEIHPPPPPHPALQKGEAQWVKIYKTELPREVSLDELTTNNPAVVPLAPTQTEIEWKLLQHNPHSPNSGALRNQGQLGGGSHAVIRRYEFYKYTGAYDPGDHGALCAGDGSCNAPLDGELGDYIGSQMAAANLGALVPGTPTATPTTPVSHTGTPSTPSVAATATPAGTATAISSQTTDATASPTATRTTSATGTPSLSVTPTPTPTHGSCVGDCRNTHQVTVLDLVTMVNIALGSADVSTCTAGDANDDGTITVNEIVAGINIALGLVPCSGEPGTPTATPSGADMTQCCVAAYYVWACEQHTVAECAALAGIDDGPGVCSPNPCGELPPSDSHGICCLPNAAGDEIECEDRKASDCVAAGGVVKTSGTVCTAATCADVPPPNPDVMCCLPNATSGEIECEDRTVSACAAGGGVSKGAGVCAPTTCADVPPPDIRCCVAKQSGTVIECEDLTAEACAAQGGVNMGAGTCSSNPCTP